jgi:hypothetical protein
MFDTLYSQIGAIFMVAVLLFAFLKGDEPERISAGGYAVAWLASMLVQDDSDLYGVQWGLFAVDLVVLLMFGGLVWKFRRSWLIWASAFQLLAVSSHIMVMFDLRPSMDAFITVLNIATYCLLISMAVGTFWAWQERRAAGLE